MLLSDKVAIISGIGPGLGQELAHAAAREGAKVVLAARTESYLEEVDDPRVSFERLAECPPALRKMEDWTPPRLYRQSGYYQRTEA